MKQQPRFGLTAGTLGLGTMLTDVNGVYPGILLRQQLQHQAMDLRDKGSREIFPGRPGLIRGNYNFKPRLIQAGDGVSSARQQTEPLRMIDIPHLFIDGAVTIQKYRGLHSGSLQPVARACSSTSATEIDFRHW